MIKKLAVGGVICLGLLVMSGSAARANHSWGGYHWARTSNPFNLMLADNVTADWDLILATTIGDWSVSEVLDLTRVDGINNPKRCKPTAGRVEVCNSAYGKNGWLGIAQIWTNGLHIVQGVTKVNDSYMSKAPYNTLAWKNLVMCQEVGHTLGLDHQDENFSNTPLGTCMDYSNDPEPNQQPNLHDYEELALIYAHLDSISTLGQGLPSGRGLEVNQDDPSQWGRLVKQQGRTAIYERDFGQGQRLFTFVILAE